MLGLFFAVPSFISHGGSRSCQQSLRSGSLSGSERDQRWGKHVLFPVEHQRSAQHGLLRSPRRHSQRNGKGM